MRDQAEQLREKLLQKHKGEAKTIAIVSGKGGVGKSNVALNFALSLSKKKKKVLLFDLDIGMGNIDILLGLSPKYTIVNLFHDQLSIHDIIEVGPESLSYIAAGTGLSDIFQLDEEKFNFFLDQFQSLLNIYDFILFDMGAGISVETLHYVLAANECFVVTTTEPTSMTDAYGMIKHIAKRDSKLPMYLLVNRAYNDSSGKETMKRLQNVVQQFLSLDLNPLGILPDDRTVTRAVSRQIPFLLFDQKAMVSVAMEHIVNQYLEEHIDLSKKLPFTFVSRLKHYLLER
ncbi:MinD/ParA family protein [Bacillaceae bacterium S4-13-56]